MIEVLDYNTAYILATAAGRSADVVHAQQLATLNPTLEKIESSVYSNVSITNAEPAMLTTQKMALKTTGVTWATNRTRRG